MLITNVGGISWTIYNCFFAEHNEMEEKQTKKQETPSNFNNA